MPFPRKIELNVNGKLTKLCLRNMALTHFILRHSWLHLACERGDMNNTNTSQYVLDRRADPKLRDADDLERIAKAIAKRNRKAKGIKHETPS